MIDKQIKFFQARLEGDIQDENNGSLDNKANHRQDLNGEGNIDSLKH